MTSFELWSRLNGPVANLHSGKRLSLVAMPKQRGASSDQCVLFPRFQLYHTRSPRSPKWLCALFLNGFQKKWRFLSTRIVLLCVVMCGVRDLSINGASRRRRYGTADRIMMLVCLTCSAQRKRSTRLLKQRCQHSKNQSPSGLFSSQGRGRETENGREKDGEKSGGKIQLRDRTHQRLATLWQRCGNRGGPSARPPDH